MHEIMTKSHEYLVQQLNGTMNNTSLNGVFLTEILINTELYREHLETNDKVLASTENHMNYIADRSKILSEMLKEATNHLFTE